MQTASARSRPFTFDRFLEEAQATARLGAPLIVAQLAQVSITFVDTVMAGNLSAKDLAAVAVGANVWMPMWVTSLGLLLSVTPSVAQLFGAGKYAEAGHCVRQGLWLSQAAAIASIIIVRNAEPLLWWLGIAPEIVPTAVGYLNAISWGIPAICAFQVLRCLSEGISMTKPILYVSLLALPCNIAGNYIFMYGKLGMPRLGAAGCGVASAIVMWLMFGYLLAYVWVKPQYRPLGAFSQFEWPRWKEFFALVRLGTPIALSLFMEVSLFAAVALLIGTMGTTAVAGHQIALNVASITFMIPLGVSMATTIRVGQAIGRKDIAGARFAGISGIALGAASMACAAAFIFVFPEFIAGIYTDDREVKTMAVSLLAMAAVFQISDGLQVSGSGALRGLKDTKTPMVMTFIAYWIIGLPLGYFLGISLGGGPRAMWIGFICALTAAAFLLNARFHLVTRRLLRGLDHGS
jgi:MATE family multidrug resistance protein